MSVTDVRGSLVYAATIEGTTERVSSVDIPTSGLTQGIYNVVIVSGAHTVLRRFSVVDR